VTVAASSGTDGGSLVEVAVALPVFGTFTYRDPRPGSVVAPGSQVVVPFGARTVTGFVLGRAAPSGLPSPVSAAAPREIESIVGGLPAFDEEMLALCRWAAEYYHAPLGEMLRAGLPQGERAVAIRSVRLTARGARVLAESAAPGAETTRVETTGRKDPVRSTTGLLWSPLDMEGGRGGEVAAGDAGGPGPAGLPVGARFRLQGLLQSLADAGGEMSLRALAKRLPGAALGLRGLESAGLIETGDEVHDRRREPVETFVSHAVATPTVAAARAAISPRARGRRAVLARVDDAAGGVPLGAFSPAERAHVHTLVRLGLLRLEHRPPSTRPVPPIAVPVFAPGLVSSAVAAGAPGPAGTAESASRSSAVPTPTRAQGEAIAAIVGHLGRGYATFLLRGVTGSGKTEVYLRAIAEARAMGRGALVMVPEIALTPQLAARFRARFGDDVAVLHSGLPPRERLAAWRRLRSGEVGIALGARSAVFAPVRALGIVVVDEEHDSSFKQDEGVRYNGRDLAIVRAQRAEAVAVLGSATPSLESFRNAELGRYRSLLLPERATPRPLPPVEIVDLRRWPPGPDGLLSPILAEAIAVNLAAGQQTILFLNRRGFSTFVLCRACGHAIRCAHCAVSLTYHQGRNRLVCHYCGTHEAVPERCPACRQPALERLGTGTERAEAIVRARFPDARIARLDRDTAGEGTARAARGTADPTDRDGPPGGGLDRVLRGMASGHLDILIGTQMVTKGHDFGGVTLVGVLQPDQSMHLPDFRATERVFQLLEQVAGRAGRGDRPGRVLIQTYLPEHPAVVAVMNHDYEGFVRGELQSRRSLGYPPYTRMTVLRLDAALEAAGRESAILVAERATRAGGPAVVLRGPAPAPIARIRGRFRFQVWLASVERGALAAATAAALAVKLPREVRLAVDVDPQSSL
jgi:primosomal protein N' (replication factor Y) (superfamily II helicase)